MKPTREQKIQWARDSGAGFACETLLADGKDADDLLCRLIDIAYAAGQASEVPEGWKLVPVEPTEEMYRAAYDLANRSAIDNYGAPPPVDDLWFVMVSAAPSQEGGES